MDVQTGMGAFAGAKNQSIAVNFNNDWSLHWGSAAQRALPSL